MWFYNPFHTKTDTYNSCPDTEEITDDISSVITDDPTFLDENVTYKYFLIPEHIFGTDKMTCISSYNSLLLAQEIDRISDTTFVMLQLKTYKTEKKWSVIN
jgi:hypothetical protein